MYRTVATDSFSMDLEFTRLENGYEFTQVDDLGPFEEMVTRITVSEDETAEVTIVSWFTFGGRLAVIKDWFAAPYRRRELDCILTELDRELTSTPLNIH